MTFKYTRCKVDLVNIPFSNIPHARVKTFLR